MNGISNGFLDQLRFLVSSGNLRAALEHLNMQSRLRFTALLRADEPSAASFLLVDRDDPSPPTVAWLQRQQAYRAFVEAAATTCDETPGDFSVLGHPACSDVRAYCGLPLLSQDGGMWGTLCQFDLVPAAIQPSTMELMREVAAALNPTAVREAHRTYLENRVDRLSDMQDVIAAVSDAGEDARQLFDSFADPLRAEAFRKLEAADALALEARISAIWSNVSSGRRG